MSHPARARPSPAGLFALLALAVVAAAGSGCGGGAGGEGTREEGAAGTAEDGGGATTEAAAAVPRFSSSQSFLDGYWMRPVPLQGAPPETFSPLEASLAPAACGTCHPAQYADWQTAVHAGAYSPGLSGQLVNWEKSAYQSVRSCLACHAPLSEQSAMIPAEGGTGGLVPNPAFDPELRNQGLVCAACHVRGWNRYGPPRRDGSLDPSPPNSPHGGVTRTPFFEDSRFCAGCHQFAAPAPNGKSLQNTYAEWQESRWAAEGVSCQGCHMPDRRHLWRGIHDPEMVRTGVTIEWTRGSDPQVPTIGLRITNSGTGHRFPTYVTPEVLVEVELLDERRRPLPGGQREMAIVRRVESRGGTWIELSDTRLPPDSSATLKVALPRGAVYARGRVMVRPDAFYEKVFESLLGAAINDSSRSLLDEAHRRTIESPYPIFDDTTGVAP